MRRTGRSFIPSGPAEGKIDRRGRLNGPLPRPHGFELRVVGQVELEWRDRDVLFVQGRYVRVRVGLGAVEFGAGPEVRPAPRVRPAVALLVIRRDILWDPAGAL